MKSKIVLATVSTILALLIAEGIVRYFRLRAFQPQEGENFLYRHDEKLGWHPMEGAHGIGGMDRAIDIRNNQDGFRDGDHGEKSRPRVLFLGDSFVWGYDVDSEERFTEKLQAQRPDWEVLNVGVAGYGTDQELLLLKAIYDRYDPDITFLVFTNLNDRQDNSTDNRYGGFHKPYFVQDHGELLERGIPVPMNWSLISGRLPVVANSRLVRGTLKILSERANRKEKVPDPTELLIGEMNRFVQTKRGHLVVGLTNETRDPRVEQALKMSQIPSVDLSTSLRFPNRGNHWTPEGHTAVSQTIAGFLGPQMSER